jgi:hypothetical protein
VPPDGRALPRDGQRSPVRHSEDGLGGSEEWDARRGRGGSEPDRCPQHSAEGNPPGKLANPRTGKGTAGRSRPFDPQGQAVLRPPAMLVGCALRREELAVLDVDTIQSREGRWVGADLEGKGRRARTVAIRGWVKQGIDTWMTAAGVAEGVVATSTENLR